MIPDKTTPDPGPGVPEQEHGLRRVARAVLDYLADGAPVPARTLLAGVSEQAGVPQADVATALSRLGTRVALDDSRGVAGYRLVTYPPTGDSEVAS